MVDRSSPAAIRFQRTFDRVGPFQPGPFQPPRVDSLHAACDVWCEFPVADRPDAIKKWLRTSDSRRGAQHYLLIETDYVWRRAMPAPPPNSPAIAFHFDYIDPKFPKLPEVIRKLIPEEKRDSVRVEDVMRSGPAPVMIKRSDLVRLIDEYERIAAAIEADDVAKERLGWVREMYAYDVAAAVTGVKHDVQEPSATTLIAQVRYSYRHTCFTHPSVSTFDRVGPFQLTDT